MHEWRVTLTQPAAYNPRPVTFGKHIRRHTATVVALDPRDAARRAQRTLPGWTATVVERAA